MKKTSTSRSMSFPAKSINRCSRSQDFEERFIGTADLELLGLLGFSSMGEYGIMKGTWMRRYGILWDHRLQVPSGYVKIAIENHNFQWENSLEMVIFHSYVKLPEGTC